MGELMLMYGISDFAFVGGSLVKHGGHNPLEPLAFKLPVVSGKAYPSISLKFYYLALRSARCVANQLNRKKALAEIIDKLLNSKEARQRLGNVGYEVLIENRGALQRLLDLLHPYLPIFRRNHK